MNPHFTWFDVAAGRYLFLTFVLVVTPGVTTAVVLRNTVEGGWQFGVATAAGAAVANSTHALAAGLGLALLFQRWPDGLAMLRWSGAAYLAWLGVSTLRRSLRARPQVDARVPVAGGRGLHSSLRQGLVVNLLNPAIIVFYLVVVPMFVPSGAGLLAFAVLAAIHVAMAFACHLSWAFLFSRLRGLARNAGPLRVLEAGTAAALLYLAVRTFLRS
jgi:threonine/homoserine/homoserine lactone efflux protein